MQHSFVSRIFSVIFTISGALLFLIFGVLLNIFIFEIDLSQYLKINIPNMSNNDYFDIFKLDYIKAYKHSKFSTIAIKIIFNISLLLGFWVQHIIMSNKIFKNFMENLCYYQSFERGLYTLGNYFFLK